MRVHKFHMTGVGIVATLLGMLGIGCASCGSVIIASFLGISATAAFFTFLAVSRTRGVRVEHFFYACFSGGVRVQNQRSFVSNDIKK